MWFRPQEVKRHCCSNLHLHVNPKQLFMDGATAKMDGAELYASATAIPVSPSCRSRSQINRACHPSEQFRRARNIVPVYNPHLLLKLFFMWFNFSRLFYGINCGLGVLHVLFQQFRGLLT